MEGKMFEFLFVAVVSLLVLSVDCDSVPEKDFASSKAARFIPFRPWKRADGSYEFGSSKAHEGSSEFVKMRYHMGPVLSPKIHVYLIWYGDWKSPQQQIIRDFINSVSNKAVPAPSLNQWWNIIRLYGDQTRRNITEDVQIGGERKAPYTHGHSLNRLDIQDIIRVSLQENGGSLPANAHGGLYLVLTAEDVMMDQFCRAVCAFHYFTFPGLVGYTMPYAWIGHSGKQCPEVCAYPFAIPVYMNHTKAMHPPNGEISIDGMISVIAHELAEIATNPLINAWYAGEDPVAPTEVADLCEGMYGSGAGGGYAGNISTDPQGLHYNLNGINGRRFLVQWIWSPEKNACTGPNALD